MYIRSPQYYHTGVKQEQKLINFVELGVTPWTGVKFWNTGAE